MYSTRWPWKWADSLPWISARESYEDEEQTEIDFTPESEETDDEGDDLTEVE